MVLMTKLIDEPRIYDYAENSIVSRFLDMCTTTSSTAESIYSALDNKLTELLQCDNPWTSVGVAVNIGIRN